MPPLVLSAPYAFERFTESVVKAAIPDQSWPVDFQQPWQFLSGQQNQKHTPDILISDLSGVRAVGDAKYKDVLERAGEATLTTAAESLQVGIHPADWNQLYVYMRMKMAASGFFLLPFWNANGPCVESLFDFQFSRDPVDGRSRVAVFALNLLKPLTIVKQEAAKKIRQWLLAEKVSA